MTWYPTQSHYPDTEPTSSCPILIMPSAWLGSTEYRLDQDLNPQGSDSLISKYRRQMLYSFGHSVYGISSRHQTPINTTIETRERPCLHMLLTSYTDLKKGLTQRLIELYTVVDEYMRSILKLRSPMKASDFPNQKQKSRVDSTYPI